MKSKFSKATAKVALSIAAFVAIMATVTSCKDDDGKPKVDCSTVTGATFTSNSGKVAALLESKCATAGCHATGGAGAEHWEWSTDYDTVKEHFGHMLEAVEAGTMPEEGSTELTDEEMDQLLCWQEAGFPE